PLQLGVSRSLALSKAFARGLGRSFRARRGVAGNLCRSAAPSRDGVPGGELDVCGEHERISPDSRGIHGYAANSQDGVSPTAAARCLPNPVRRDSLSTLSTRRHNHETDGRADAFAPLVFFADFRSPPGPKGGAIVCPWCWGSPRGPCCAGCAVTRPSRIGRKAWGRNRESALAAVAKRVVMSCPASTSCAMC